MAGLDAPAHPSETGGAAVATRKAPLFPSLATLLAGHVLRDGEVVLLILKPSLWYILFSAMRFAAGVLIVVIAGILAQPSRTHAWYEAGVFLLAGRVMWSTLQWMGRLYVLTDQRVLRLSGVFTIDVFDCPLRQVGQTRMTYSFRERLWRLGSIEILPIDERRPMGVWQTVRQPNAVLEQVDAAVRKAKSGGTPCL